VRHAAIKKEICREAVARCQQATEPSPSATQVALRMSLGVRGEGDVFEGAEGVSITEIEDGTSKTIVIAEAARPWKRRMGLHPEAHPPVVSRCYFLRLEWTFGWLLPCAWV
jgi:hypothetical protein